MLLGSFYTGLSGLQANSTALNVVGNNLANVNTVGYKRGQANFQQIMSNTLVALSGASNPMQIGLGVRTGEILSKFEQGSIQTTGIKTQLAIQGDGFFMVNSGGDNLYTRAGNFTFNNEGYLVAANGGRVQGFPATDGVVDTTTAPGDLRVDLGVTGDPNPTSLVRFLVNLSASQQFDPDSTSDYTTSIEFFDSKGLSHTMTLAFKKNGGAGDSSWTYEITVDDANVTITDGSEAAGSTSATGTMVFDTSGNLATINTGAGAISVADAGSSDLTLSLDNFSNGAAAQDITWDIEDGETGTSFYTEFGSTYGTGTLFQDGYGSGSLQDIDFQQDGTMVGFFSNGITLALGKVAVATFTNNHGLKQIDGNFFIPTNASGSQTIRGDEVRASILSSSLETSNVDIAEEFTQMIVNQRGYQSNSRTITTIDQLLQEAINLKR